SLQYLCHKAHFQQKHAFAEASNVEDSQKEPASHVKSDFLALGAQGKIRELCLAK
ncbi:unnamed protein product, partial [Sphagnum jensenii]